MFAMLKSSVYLLLTTAAKDIMQNSPRRPASARAAYG
jgi:hypothetical protein